MKMDILEELYVVCDKVYGNRKKKHKFATKLSWVILWVLVAMYFAYWFLRYTNAL